MADVIVAHYYTDTGKLYPFYPYQAFLDTSKEIKNPEELTVIIPQSIQLLMESFPKRFLCKEFGIKPRYLEIFDFYQNRYVVECPKPFLQISGLINELDNNPKIIGWIGHGERINYEQLIKL